MNRKRRDSLSAFNLSFLDIMFCGFGAVVLLVLIIHSQTVRSRNERHQDLKAQVELLKSEVEAETRIAARLKNSLEEVDQQIEQMEGRSSVVLSEIERTRQETSRYLQDSLASREAVEQLKSDLKSLDQVQKRRLAEIRDQRSHGRRALEFTGQGRRQYLTGLRLGGSRVLILLDASASMLDETIVGIIRRRNMPRSQMLRSAKWRQALRTVRWLLANLPMDSRVKVALFSRQVRFLGQGSGKWTSMKDRGGLGRIMDELASAVPKGGTDLLQAFSAASSMRPAPDNIILLTDGLPTMAGGRPRSGKVGSDKRVQLFKKAVEKLPRSVPVNTILFPLEGDPMAPSMFWKLAVKTRGSFLTPSRDWP